MIDAKQAVQIAKQKAAEVLNGLPLRLEELERDSYKGRDVWSLTLSFAREVQHPMQLFPESLYKRFLIDAETGELVAIKIREVTSQ
jgi:hypothetical protein